MMLDERAATASATPAKPSVKQVSSTTRASQPSGFEVIRAPISAPTIRMIAAWNSALVAVLAALPSRMLRRGIGAARYSFIIPRSRSSSSAIPPPTAPPSAVSARMPGTMNDM